MHLRFPGHILCAQSLPSRHYHPSMDQLSSLPLLPPRPPDAHKGTFGTALVVGGCVAPVRMIGAPALAAHGAARAGAGLVRILAPAPILDVVLSAALFATGAPLAVEPDGSPTTHLAVRTFDDQLRSATSVVLGPGLGVSPGSTALTLRAITQESIPVVLDADSLNALAQTPEFHRDLRAPAILTPHPGEFIRLERALGMNGQSPPAGDEDRTARAGSLARRAGCVVVLKGACTIVTDGHRAWQCSLACPCLATGGTGDVLAGVIGGLLAQHGPAASRVAPHADLLWLAAIAVEAHARAATLWAESVSRDDSDRPATAGMIATDLPAFVGRSLARLRSD